MDGNRMSEPEQPQGGAEPSEAHNLASAGSTPAPASNKAARVDFSRFAMGEMIPLKGYWFKVAGRDGNHLVLRFVSMTVKGLKNW